MPRLRTAILAGAATLLVATAAVAATAQFHKMDVALPDGSVAHVEYAGDVAPEVTVLPVAADAGSTTDPFAELDRMSAMLERQSQEMMQRAAQMQRDAAAGAGQVMVSTGHSAGGSYHYSYVSSSMTSNGNCTQTMEWHSDGSSKEPQMTRTSSGDCDSVKRGQTVVPAAAAAKPDVAGGRTI